MVVLAQTRCLNVKTKILRGITLILKTGTLEFKDFRGLKDVQAQCALKNKNSQGVVPILRKRTPKFYDFRGQMHKQQVQGSLELS